MAIFNYKFNSDRLQFYLFEAGATEGLYEVWTREEVQRNLWIRQGAFGIWTYPYMDVTSDVTLEICEFAPGLAEGDWQRINECSLKFCTGAWGLSYWGWPGYGWPGMTEGWDVRLFAIEPGNYRARIYYGNQSVLAEKIAQDLESINLKLDDETECDEAQIAFLDKCREERWLEPFKIELWPAQRSAFKVIKAVDQDKVPPPDEYWQWYD